MGREGGGKMYKRNICQRNKGKGKKNELRKRWKIRRAKAGRRR